MKLIGSFYIKVKYVGWQLFLLKLEMNGTDLNESATFVSLIHPPLNFIFAVLMYSIGIFCTVGNVFAILVLHRAGRLIQPSTKRHTSLILFNLALAGIFIGILWCPICATQLLTEQFRNSSSFENVRRFLGIELPGAFIGFIASISYDRFLILKHIANHNKRLTKRKAIFFITLSWLIPLPVPMIRFINKIVFTYIVVFVILFGFGVIAITYLYMLQIVYESERRVRLLMQLGATSLAMLSRPARSHKKTLRLTRTASVLIITYLICHIPFAVFLLIRILSPSFLSPYISQIWFLTSECLTQINACLNPGIYFMTSKAYLKEIRKLFPSKNLNFDTVGKIVNNGVEMRSPKKLTALSSLPNEGVPRLIRVAAIPM